MKIILNNILLVLFSMLACTTYTTAQNFPEMIKIDGGAFQMGDNHYIGFDDEMPLHTVFVNTYEIGKTEVTVAQWRYYCKQNNLEMPPPPDWGWHDDHPITNILWKEAVAYCKWLSNTKKEAYRLPTEAEWEYAAKGGVKVKGYKYSGSQWIDTVAWYSGNSNKTTHPVARKMPNELGIYDMTGNAWEWCLDVVARVYSVRSATNPLEKNESANRVVKGGAFIYNNSVCRTAYRFETSIADRRIEIGLRVVKEISR